THYDFKGKHLTPYGGLFPVATMLEKLDFRKLVAEALTVKRIPRVMTIYQFVLGMVLALYVGFARLNHIRFVAQDPMLTGILKVCELPGQSTFWRFLASLHLNVAQQLLQLQRILRERVWEAANVRLQSITLDTDTTVHTVYGKQMGARKSYNPKNKGKKSFQPILTFMAETREYVWGELRNGDRPDGKQIARHLKNVFTALPRCIQPIDLLVWFYRQRAGAENLIKEANNDAGLAAHPSGRWATNCVHFQLVMLAYNLNCWLLLFQREEGVPAEELQHTTLATARLRF